LLKMVENFTPDLVYITNADFCWPKTLESIRKRSVPIMCFYHDPPWKDRPGSRFSENIMLFDLVATTRRWHEAEFRAAGAKAVSVVRFGYEPLAHFPVEAGGMATERYGADIVFIGSYRAHRSRELHSLVTKNFHYSFRLWGNDWVSLPPGSPIRMYWQGRDVHEQEIPIIYASSKLALHWINWEPNSKDPALQRGDQHNSRTFQIAACGGAMMVAQRTEEHKNFFKEGAEAVYFDDVKELREKLAYWLDPGQQEVRKRIAAAARARCLSEDYSYVPVVRSFLKFFGLPVVQTP
jgi:hypothetical protein